MPIMLQGGIPLNYFLDLVILGAFVLFTAVGVKRGFIKSAAHFLGSVLAAFLASALGGAIAKWVFAAMFREALVEKIGVSLASLGGNQIGAAVEHVLESLPDFLVRALADAGITANSLEAAAATGSGRAAELIADALAPVFISFLKVLAVLVLFLLFMMLVRLLADLLSGLFYLPLLRQVNGLLGGVFGFLLALIVVWIVLSALWVFLPMLSMADQTKVEAALDRSFLAGLIAGLNPMRAMFG